VADGDIAQMPQAISGPARLKIFISYSRKDAVFARGLADALATRGYEPDFDQANYDPDNIATGIAAEDEWWQRLQQMIAVASTMVFIVSPDSASSKVCDEEIAWARGLGKRIIPILRRSVDFAKAPPRLSSLNIKLYFTSDNEPAFTASLDDLCKVLDRNVAWHRETCTLRRCVSSTVRTTTAKLPQLRPHWRRRCTPTAISVPYGCLSAPTEAGTVKEAEPALTATHLLR
jgi:hypothetical protein